MNANCDTPQNSDSRSHTEDRILQAAEAEFLAKGYAGARTTAIAEAAGVTHAMLHYYFRTKDKLFERILNEKIQLVRDIMLFGIGDPGARLRKELSPPSSVILTFWRPIRRCLDLWSTRYFRFPSA